MALDATLDIISKLNEVYSRLNVMIIDFSPKTPEERQQLRLLLSKRDELRDTIREALSKGFKQDAEELQKASIDLTAAAKELDKVLDTSETVKIAISVAAKVIGIVAQVIALVA
jgi:hypothetical protein